MNLRSKFISMCLVAMVPLAGHASTVAAAGTTPTSIQATSTDGTGTAEISWATNGATNYQARIRIGDVTIKTSPSLGSSISRFTFTGLEYNVPYTLQVRALSGTWSNYGPVSPTIVIPKAASPSAPSQPSVSVVDDKKIKAEWAPPASNGGSPIASYSVQLMKGSDAVGDPISTSSLETTLDVADTTNLYSVTVAAVNEASMKSPPSAASTAIAAEKKAVAVVNLPSNQGNNPSSGGSGNSPSTGSGNTSSSGNATPKINQLTQVVSPAPVVPAYVKVIKVKATTTSQSVLALSKIPIPKGSKTFFEIPPSSKNICVVRGTTVKNLKAGTCRVKVEVATKAGKRFYRTVKLIAR